MKRFLSLFFVLLLMSCDSLPTKIDFEDWLATQYLNETKNYAHHIYIISWEKTEDSVRKDYPGLDGWDVKAAITTNPYNMNTWEFEEVMERGTITEQEAIIKTKFHFAFCSYLSFDKKWRFTGNSWSNDGTLLRNEEAKYQAIDYKIDWIRKNSWGELSE